MSRGRLENFLGRNRNSHRADRDYMLLHKNDNNRGKAAVKFRWLCVWVSEKVPLELRKAFVQLQKEGGVGVQKALSAIHLSPV